MKKSGKTALFSLGVADIAMTSFQNESKGRDVLSFGVKLSFFVRAYIPRVLCFFLSHLSQGCATEVSAFLDDVPFFRKNIGLFRGNVGDFRENKGGFRGDELILRGRS